MAAETQFEPAITAGTPVVRSFDDRFTAYPRPYRTSLEVENRDTTDTILLRPSNGPVRRIGPGRTVELRGVFHWYTVDATGNMSAGDFTVYENGGLDEAIETETDVVA